MWGQQQAPTTSSWGGGRAQVIQQGSAGFGRVPQPLSSSPFLPLSSRASHPAPLPGVLQPPHPEPGGGTCSPHSSSRAPSRSSSARLPTTPRWTPGPQKHAPAVPSGGSSHPPRPAVAPHPLLLESWTLVTAVSPLSATISSFALAPQSLRLLSKSLVPHPGHALGIVGMETAAGPGTPVSLQLRPSGAKLRQDSWRPRPGPALSRPLPPVPPPPSPLPPWSGSLFL